MPRQDKTGPMGAGPMTGRGMGSCGSGNGRGRGYGMGLGRRSPSPVTEEEKKTTLEKEAQYLKEDLNEVEKEIDSLKK
jgi:hypothetical protein